MTVCCVCGRPLILLSTRSRSSYVNLDFSVSVFSFFSEATKGQKFKRLFDNWQVGSEYRSRMDGRGERGELELNKVYVEEICSK